VLIDPPHCTLFATIEPVLEFNVTRPLSLIAEIEPFTVVADIDPPRSRKTTGALCDCTPMLPSTPLISTEPELMVTCALACVVSALGPSICTTPDPSVSWVLLPKGTVMSKSMLLDCESRVSLLVAMVMVVRVDRGLSRPVYYSREAAIPGQQIASAAHPSITP